MATSFDILVGLGLLIEEAAEGDRVVARGEIPQINGDRLPAVIVAAAPIPNDIIVAVETNELSIDADQHVCILVTIEFFVGVEQIGEGDLGV
ncbi:MAG: hypothetical protein HON62_02145 [Rhodospirillaceae bacterium]|nr:hypothetical protein [Rhodospirillaceae bacterium]MBT6404855.1 hypothetical protein [Rhodospirillaceae bacterium]